MQNLMSEKQTEYITNHEHNTLIMQIAAAIRGKFVRQKRGGTTVDPAHTRYNQGLTICLFIPYTKMLSLPKTDISKMKACLTEAATYDPATGQVVESLTDNINIKKIFAFKNVSQFNNVDTDELLIH